MRKYEIREHEPYKGAKKFRYFHFKADMGSKQIFGFKFGYTMTPYNGINTVLNCSGYEEPTCLCSLLFTEENSQVCDDVIKLVEDAKNLLGFISKKGSSKPAILTVNSSTVNVNQTLPKRPTELIRT